MLLYSTSKVLHVSRVILNRISASVDPLPCRQVSEKVDPVLTRYSH